MPRRGYAGHRRGLFSVVKIYSRARDRLVLINVLITPEAAILRAAMFSEKVGRGVVRTDERLISFHKAIQSAAIWPPCGRLDRVSQTRVLERSSRFNSRMNATYEVGYFVSLPRDGDPRTGRVEGGRNFVTGLLAAVLAVTLQVQTTLPLGGAGLRVALSDLLLPLSLVYFGRRVLTSPGRLQWRMPR